MAFVALIIGCIIGALPGAQAQYASAEQDRHVLYFDKTTTSVGVTLTENGYWSLIDGNANEGLEFKANDYSLNKTGMIKTKEPIISNPTSNSNCYMRVCLRIIDGDGNPIEPEGSGGKAEGIFANIWYDTTGSDSTGTATRDDHYLTDNNAPNDAEGKSFYANGVTKAELQELKDAGSINQYCNTSAFEDPLYNSEMKAYVFNYKGIFTSGKQVSLFNRVVYPSDMTQQDWQNIQGEYYIVVWAQAIQVKGFSSASDALSHLSNEYVPTTNLYKKS